MARTSESFGWACAAFLILSVFLSVRATSVSKRPISPSVAFSQTTHEPRSGRNNSRDPGNQGATNISRMNCTLSLWRARRKCAVRVEGPPCNKSSCLNFRSKPKLSRDVERALGLLFEVEFQPNGTACSCHAGTNGEKNSRRLIAGAEGLSHSVPVFIRSVKDGLYLRPSSEETRCPGGRTRLPRSPCYEIQLTETPFPLCAWLGRSPTCCQLGAGNRDVVVTTSCNGTYDQSRLKQLAAVLDSLAFIKMDSKRTLSRTTDWPNKYFKFRFGA